MAESLEFLAIAIPVITVLAKLGGLNPITHSPEYRIKRVMSVN